MIQNVWYQRFKRKELLEKAEQCGEEIKKFQNVLEQGSKQRDKVVKSKDHLSTCNTPYTMKKN